MEISVRLLNKESIFITTTSIFVFLLTFPLIGGPIVIGLDPSFAFASNYFFVNNFQAGRDIIFTYGPLGFLFYLPQPISNNLFFSTIVISFLKFIFILSFLYLNFLIKKHTSHVHKLLGLVIIFLASSLIDIGYILVFLPAIHILLHKETANKTYLVSAIFISAFALMIKSLLGVLSIFLVISYSIIDYFETKNIRRLFFINLGIFLSFVFIWLFLYYNFSGIGNFLYGTLQLSLGNSSAMTLNPDNNWVLLSLFIILFFYLPFNIKDKRITFLYGMFLLSLLASWKYAFSRVSHIHHASHIHHFYFFVIFFYSLLLVYLKDIKFKYLLIILISLFSFSANMKSIGIDPPNIINQIKKYVTNGVKLFNTNVLDFKNYEKGLIKQSRDNLKNNVLKENILQIIGRNSVDTYPWETTYIPANNLNWQPRPVFQSYVAFTPWLDNKNAEFFDSDKAPQFILWELEHWGGEAGSIDERYLLNDEPSTVYKIFSHYRPVYGDLKITLFERVSKPVLKEPRVIGQTKGRWEEWIKVPSTDNGILRAKINFSRKFLGKLKRIIYKEEEFFISYELENGEIKKYRLVIDNAVSGVWINPLIVKISNPFYALRVKKIMLSHSKYDFIMDDVTIDWQLIETHSDEAFAETHLYESESKLQKIKPPKETNNISFFIDGLEQNEKTIKISGWACIYGRSSEDSKTYILLKSNRNNYVFDTYPHRRPDVTAYYKPLNLNLDDSGFSAVIDRRLIKSGEYKVGIYIKKNRVESLQLIGETIAITNNKVLRKESF